MSYEDKILNMQESIADDCKDCEHKKYCRSQCMEIKEIYNPVIAPYKNKM